MSERRCLPGPARTVADVRFMCEECCGHTLGRMTRPLGGEGGAFIGEQRVDEKPHEVNDGGDKEARELGCGPGGVCMASIIFEQGN